MSLLIGMIGAHQLRPVAIEMALVALAGAEVTRPRAQLRIEALLPQTHLNVHYLTSRDHAPGRLRAFLPVVDVVLLERPRRSETAQARQANRFLDGRWRLPVDEDPRPDLRLVGPPRMPDAHR